jgi:hypothetical protein
MNTRSVQNEPNDPAAGEPSGTPTMDSVATQSSRRFRATGFERSYAVVSW